MDVDEQAQKFAIHAACREGQTQKVESLLNADKRLASRRDDDDRLPLHWAASYNRLPIVELLSDQKSFDVDAQDGAGWTALMMAASLKDSEPLIDFLLNKGVEVDVKNSAGQTAVFFACSKSNLDVVRKLVVEKKASARIRDRRGQMAIHRAAAVGATAIVKLLLKEGKSPVDATDQDGCTALHHAVAEGHGDTALELLKAGAESNKRDRDGKLAIDLAPDTQVRDFILRAAEEEGIELATS
ncbi:proteasome regulatory particle subunit [Lecanosticta acicola]|uniref:Proteasome regulatory particle subunit n=1 Tax=Lecanosticta acicola TaxID=111012 RepID=A0AAI8YWK4_9PEZI|nr:proteasome regulatory particle subunit [Lecanosticta acicola]